MAQDSLRCLKMAPKMFQEAPRPPQNGSKKPNSFSRKHPKCPNPSKTGKKTSTFCPDRSPRIFPNESEMTLA
eukprot:6752721-Pyramimonas_sp.AAC.1